MTRRPVRTRTPSPAAVILFALFPLLSLLLTAPLRADTLTVAVAANFAETLEQLAERFEQQSAHQVRLVRGSSGRHYAQLINGAPFDLFFSADAVRPATLRERLQLPADSLHTYAVGRLALWAPQSGSADAAKKTLENKQFRTLAIANPRLAPYGQAAVETLASLGMDALLQPGASNLVRGENVAQTYQFIASRNADLGFVAFSQIKSTGNSDFWLVPQALHKPVVQQLLVVRNSAASKAFVEFLSTPLARQLITEAGYGLPAGGD